MDKKLIFALFIVMLAAIGGYFLLSNTKPKPQINKQPQQKIEQQNSATPPTLQKASLYYPMTNYVERITFRWFGKLVTPAEIASPCGSPFSGYHTGDDLEILTGESSKAIPIFAISKGTVAQIGPVSGYGGLIVLSTNINSNDYTVYYGHIDLGSSTLKKGSTVAAGQVLANLGAACSTQTNRERKHLHFAIHKGTSVDVRGYVPTLSVLANWINPKVFLQNNNAQVK